MPVIFSNQGDIPLAAIRTFGVNVKDRDDAIGFFGTGLKYAIAVLLRKRCEILMFTEGRCYTFIPMLTEIRGQEFEVVGMAPYPYDEEKGERVVDTDIVELGFTTDLGKNWEEWMAFRELYCNTTDEGGVVYHVDEAPPLGFSLEPKNTMFVVSGPCIERTWQDRSSLILETKPRHEGPLANAHIGAGRHIYYRNIRVADLLRQPARYDYNITAPVDLTEDRTLKYQFEARHAITSLVLCSDDRDFITDVLMAPNGTYEAELSFTEVSMAAGDVFLDTVAALRADMRKINRSAVQLHRQYSKKSTLPDTSIQLDEVETKQLERAVEAVKRLGCTIDDYPIIVCDTLGEGVLGRAENFAIFISRATFDQGTKMLASTIYEEYCHLKYHFDDCSRGFQNHLLDRLFSQLEKTMGEPL